MSDIEVLKLVIDQLDEISVPIKYKEQIAVPLADANNALKQLFNAVIKAAEEKQEAEKKEPAEEETSHEDEQQSV